MAKKHGVVSAIVVWLLLLAPLHAFARTPDPTAGNTFVDLTLIGAGGVLEEPGITALLRALTDPTPYRLEIDKTILTLMPKKGIVVGRVTDEAGIPVQATLDFLDAKIRSIKSKLSDGSFAKQLFPGEYKIRVRAAGYAERIYTVPIKVHSQTSVLFELIRDADGALGGTVRDAYNRPLSATISFPDRQLAPISVDAKGRFSQILLSGTCILEITRKGYVSKRIKVPIERGKTTTLDIVLTSNKPEGMLAGKVLSGNGEPLAALIVFKDRSIPPVPTDPQTGEFRVRLPPGSYDITIKSQGFKSGEMRIPILGMKKTIQDFVLEAQ